jgi:Kef-type K+ transport system membrane component KefB
VALDPLPPLGGHQLLVLLLQLGVLFLLAFALGRLAIRVGMPSVVGELCAGVLAGPTVLGHLSPAASTWLFQSGPDQIHLLDAVGQVAVLLLVGVTGAHLDTAVIRRRTATVARVSAGAFLIPVGLGIAVGYLLPAGIVGDSTRRPVFALFLAVALGVSAIPVIAKTLMDMNLLHRNVGQLTLATGLVDDMAGWLLLSVVAALATNAAGRGHLVVSMVGLLIFVAVSLAVGRPLMRRVLRRAEGRPDGSAIVIALAVLTVLGSAALTQALGLEAVFGAFVAGVVLTASGRTAARLAPLRTVVVSVLAPIFFATAGLRIDLSALAHPPVLLSAVGVLLVAVLGKFAGAGLGGWLSRMNRWETLALGAGLNARGIVEVVVATVGLRLHILTGVTYTIVILVAIATSLMAAPVLRLAMGRLDQTDEERVRAQVNEPQPAVRLAPDAR